MTRPFLCSLLLAVFSPATIISTKQHQQLLCVESVPECICDLESSTPTIDCGSTSSLVIEDIGNLALVFQEIEISPSNAETGIDVLIRLGSGIDSIPVDIFGDVPLAGCTLEAPNVAYIDFAMFQQSERTLNRVHVISSFNVGTTVLHFPDNFRDYSSFTTLTLSRMTADLRNLASPTLEVIELYSANFRPFYAWDLPALKTIYDSNPTAVKVGGYLPPWFASHLLSLEDLFLDAPVNKVDYVALVIPSQNFRSLLIVSPFFKASNSLAILTPDATIRAVYQTSGSGDPDYVLPIWAESIAKSLLEWISSGSGQLQIIREYPGFLPCPCDISWLLNEPQLIRNVQFGCRSVLTTEWIEIQDATLSDLDCSISPSY